MKVKTRILTNGIGVFKVQIKYWLFWKTCKWFVRWERADKYGRVGELVHRTFTQYKDAREYADGLEENPYGYVELNGNYFSK